jgi:hypothetical protein
MSGLSTHARCSRCQLPLSAFHVSEFSMHTYLAALQLLLNACMRHPPDRGWRAHALPTKPPSVGQHCEHMQACAPQYSWGGPHYCS